MIPPDDPPAVETLAQYHEYIAECDVLMAPDPAPESPEGMRLTALVARLTEFERKEWPSMFAPFATDDPSEMSGE
jgi:hypothetical protein